MNGTVKTLSILCLAAALGKKIKDGQRSGAHIWRGEKLQEAGLFASNKYKANLNGGILKKVHKKICDIIGNSPEGDLIIPIGVALSFLNCGLIDLYANGKPKYRKNLDLILKRMVWSQRLYDVRLDKWDDHTKGLALYYKWGGK